MKLTHFEASGTVLKLELDLSDERLACVEGVAFTDGALDGVEGEPILTRSFHVWGDRRSEGK
jgi:hypothetical protein